MSFSFIGSNSDDASAASSITVPKPSGSLTGNLVIVVFSFENVAPSSGPWIDPSGGTEFGPANGWKQLCWQAPSATGTGIEVWAAIIVSWTVAHAAGFYATESAVAASSCWSGQYGSNVLTDGTVRAAVTAQVTGNEPEAPSIFAFQNELVVACGADAMSSPGFGTPTGDSDEGTYTNRVDAARGSSFGNAEATLADAIAIVDGDSGAITFPGSAASTSTKGAMATLAIRPAASPTVSTAPMVVAEYR